MKNIITMLLLAGCMTGFLYAQQCEPNKISTDPDNPSPALGTSLVYHTNQFDWRAPSFTVNSLNYSYPPPPGFIWPRVESPFWNNQNVDLDYLFKFQNSDFAPEEGWELLKRDFGFVMGGDADNPAAAHGSQGLVDPNSQLVGPYLILYNRYSGVLRVFGTIGNPAVVGYDAVQVNLEFGSNQQYVSALLSYHTNVASPLDQYTQVAQTSSVAPFPSDKTLFFHADFPVAYDPCTCEFGSSLSVSFTLIDHMNVSLDGRIAATSTSVGAIANGTGTVGNPDFLAALHKNGNDVEAGVTTYKRTWDLANRYRAIADAREQAKQAAAAAGKFPKQFKAALDLLDFGLGLAGLPSIVSLFYDPDNDEDKFVLDNGKWTEAGQAYANSLKAAGYLTKFASKQVKIPSSPDEPLPELGSIIEGEMTFSGTIEDNDNYSAGIVMRNPGSLGAENALEKEYPTYNEVLGIFSVLETPELFVETFTETIPIDIINQPAELPINRDHFRFSGELNYAFNPALDINFNKTKILASIQVEVEYTHDYLPGISPENWDKNVFEIANENVYTTPWVDLECLEELEAAIAKRVQHDLTGFLEPVFYLKLLLFIEYDSKGLDDNPNRHALQVTYPLQVTEVNGMLDPEVPAYLYDLSYDQPTTFSTTETIYAWNDVYINNDLSLDPNAPPGTEVRIIAANAIEIAPNVDIDPGITLEIGLPFSCSEPIPQTQVTASYCMDKYKAKSLNPERMAAWLDSIDNGIPDQLLLEEQTRLSVFPNPSNGQFEIGYSLSENSTVKVLLQDNMGRQVRGLLDDVYQEPGAHTLNVSLQDVPDGFYHLIFRVNEMQLTKKLIKRRN
jgi:hypothetical protein